MDLVEGLAIAMATHAEALRAVLGAVKPVKRYLTRVVLHGSRVTSLVYWYAVEWGGCEYYVKIYRKWGGDGLLRPVVGLSHVANCGGRLVYYPAIDVDPGKTPPKEYLERAVVVWRYRSASKGGIAHHIVMPPVATKSQALKWMRGYDDNKHLKFAQRPRRVDHFDFAVLRVSSYPHWGEEVLYARFGDDPMAQLHRLLRSIYWL